MTWSVRLWKRNPTKLVGILAAAVFAALLGLWALHGAIGGALIGFAMIALSTADFWLPVHFTVDGTGARSRCGISVTSLDWESVKRVYEVDGGVKLTPLEQDNRFEPFRGVLLRYENNREAVLDEVRRHWEQDVRTLERGTDRGGDGEPD